MDNSQENQFFSDAALSIYNVIPNAGTDLRTEKTRSHIGFKKIGVYLKNKISHFEISES